MESRLPKPRAAMGLGKKAMENKMELNTELLTVNTAITSEIITQVNHQQALSVSTASIIRENNKCQTGTVGLGMKSGLKAIGKSKSIFNINGKTSNENKAPATKPACLPMTRSHTSAAIARNVTSKVAVKRLATTTSGSTIQAKRAHLNLDDKRNNGNVSTSDGNKGLRAAVGGGRGAKIITGKPNKWDLKGRLEVATAELASLREKHKKCGQLEKTVDELRARETRVTTRLEELEGKNETLSKELERVKNDEVAALMENASLKSDLSESQESYRRIVEALERSEMVCETQKKKVTEHEERVAILEMMVEKHKSTNNELTMKNCALQTLAHTIDKDRRVLHNAIQELKGNIRVFCRVRPRITKESSRHLCSINFIDECTMEIGRGDAVVGATGAEGSSLVGGGKGRSRQEFSFDKIFPPSASQAQVFEELSLLVQSALEGYNVCVFAYGQTGSGKTYTMEGGRDIDNEGMIPRTVRHIFEEMREFQLLGWEYKIEASFLEIYNEHIVDLLDSQQKTHEIRMADSKGHDLYVTNLQVEEIHSPEELHECLRIAQKNRAVAATFANERSSRSHSVARIRLIGTHSDKDERSIGNLNLVDLAGSERLKGGEEEGAAMRTAETKNINKSLANLGNVILALLKKQDHIPYRNSKLTHLLMPSLGGNSKTLMLLNVSPLDECYNETLNSLRFASNVNSCKTGNVKRSRTIMHNSM